MSTEPTDKRGIPIVEGDMVRMVHFRGRSGKTYYLYHLVERNENGTLEAVPLRERLTGFKGGGRFWIRPGDPMCRAIEVLDNVRNGPHVEDRRRVREWPEVKP